VVKRVRQILFRRDRPQPLRGEIMRVKAVAFALALMHVREKLEPRKKWTLFLVPHVQLDVGYTPLSP